MAANAGAATLSVAAARHFHVDDLGACLLAGLHHGAGLSDGDGAVVIAVDDVLRDVADFHHVRRWIPPPEIGPSAAKRSGWFMAMLQVP